MTKLGFVGLGRMGSAIAQRLLAAGLPVAAWNRSRPESHSALVAAGAVLVDSAQDALAAPVSFSMLADDEAAESVLTQASIGRVDIARVHVNMASISTSMAERLTERFEDAGVAYVSAPVLGRPEVARQGKLNVIVAGPSSALDAVDEYLAHCSMRRWRVGDQPRQANAAKIAVNFMILHALESLGESIALVEAQGVDPHQFVELIGSSLFGSVVHTGYGGMIAERRYSPAGFTMAMGLKDLSLAEKLAAESKIDVPTAAVLRERFETAMATTDLADLDWSAVAEVTRRGAGMKA